MYKPENVMIRSRMSVVLIALLVLSGFAAGPLAAQAVRTLAIQAGEVYIDGRRVPQDRLPASFKPGQLEVRLEITGDVADALILPVGDRLYRLGDDSLIDVTGQTGPITFFQVGPAAPTVEMQSFTAGRTAFAPLVAPQVFMFAESGQEVLVQQARELERLSQEVQAFQDQVSTVVAPGVAEANRGIDQVMQQQGISLRQLQGAQVFEIGPLADRLMLQAERTMEAARQFPQLEFRSYLNDIQEQNAALYAQLAREQRLEQESLNLANLIRRLPAGTERRQREASLRNTLEQIFELRQENRRREIAQIGSQLDELQQRLNERERLRRQIIDARFNELTGSGPNVNW
jgi:hypothetical protein